MDAHEGYCGACQDWTGGRRRRPIYWGRNGRPMSLRQWSDAFEDLAAKHVRMTAVGEVQVSTVWVGLDMGAAVEERRPLIFESMVFGGPLDGYAWRWATEAEANVGHDHVVAEVRSVLGMPQEDRQGVSDGDVAGDT